MGIDEGSGRSGRSKEAENKASLRRPITRSGESRIKDLPVFYAQPIHYEMVLATLCSFEYSDEIDTFFAQKLRMAGHDTK